MTLHQIFGYGIDKNKKNYGFVGIEIDSDNKTISVRISKMWSREDIATIPGEVKRIFSLSGFPRSNDGSYADPQMSIDLIRDLEGAIQQQVITLPFTNNVFDFEKLDQQKKLDIPAAVQLLYDLLKQDRVFFPKKPNPGIDELTRQIGIFNESITEHGTAFYGSVGEELDCNVRALLICLSAGRHLLSAQEVKPSFRYIAKPETFNESFEKFTDGIFDGDSGDLSPSHMNRMNRSRFYRPKNMDGF